LVLLLARPATTGLCTLSLHDALPISPECVHASPTRRLQEVGSLWFRHVYSSALWPASLPSPWRAAARPAPMRARPAPKAPAAPRSEEHTSELQSRFDLVCRLLLEKKK